MSDVAGPASGWPLWSRQLLATGRLDARRTLLGFRSLPVWLASLLPIAIFLVVAVIPYPAWREAGLGNATRIYGIIFQIFMLRMILFFGCVTIFSNLFRAELLDRSLHFYFLSPVRRWVLVIGKYGAGVAISLTVFTLMLVASQILLYLPFGISASAEFFFSGPGLGHFLRYLLVTVLACAGYGAVFLFFGVVVRNPILPAFGVFVWELMQFLLPPALKMLSVVHYVRGFLPVTMDEGPLAILSDPMPAPLAVLSLMLLSAAFVALSCWRVSRMEVHYD